MWSQKTIPGNVQNRALIDLRLVVEIFRNFDHIYLFIFDAIRE